MSDNIQEAVKHAVEKQHLQNGDQVDAKTAATMMDDVYRQLQKDQKDFTGKSEVPSAYMKVAATEMEKALKNYGVMDIEFHDSGKNGKADNKVGKGDTISVQTDGFMLYNPTETFNAGDRPGVTARPGQAKEDAIWKNQLPEYNKDPKVIKVHGY